MNLEYFENKILKQLFDALKEKYYKTSKLSGTIKIIPKTKEEVTEIEKLIRNGKYLKQNEINVIKINDIRKGIAKTKFSSHSLEDILNHLYGNIISKKTIRENITKENLIKYNEFISKYKETSIMNLLIKMPEKEIINYINKNEELLNNVCLALLNIPDVPTLLSVFSTDITKNPHYFDLDTKSSNLLIKFLSQLNNEAVPKNRTKKINILKNNNIVTDSYSNFVITYNLWGEDYLNILSNKKEPVILNINNIINLTKVNSKNNKILILENPSPLDYITKIDTNYGIIIGGGNPNAALYELLDKFENHVFLYHGDYDPEGLLIADKLKQKYANLELILYNKELFEKSKSDKKINSSRIKILDNVSSISLQEITKMIKKTNTVGYQEKVISDIIKYLHDNK